jgi:hypothetical protein
MVTSLISLKMVSKLIVRPKPVSGLRSLTHPLGCETETENRSGILRLVLKHHEVSKHSETSVPQAS